MTLLGRHALITGAGQGLGAEIAARYVAAGASVLLCARTSVSLEAVAARLSVGLAAGQQVLVQTADLTVEADVEILADRAQAEFPSMEILVNNAGVYGPIGAIEEVNWRAWVDAISINLLGLVAISRRVVPIMKRRRYGKIVNLSGGGATSPLPRITAYAASKAAVVRFAESLALELQEFGIDVNSIAPGVLKTRMTDQLLAAGPDQVGATLYRRVQEMSEQSGAAALDQAAALCVWLGSAASDGITGRLLAALWDPWPTLDERREELAGTDIYTLRRIVPADRGKDWDRK